ncbi:MAG: hypothetical protein ABIN94_08280 [Ferruginibacter sp.]
MKKIFSIVAFTVSFSSSFAQSAEDKSMKQKIALMKAHYMDSLAWNIPILRQAGLSTEVFAPGNIKSNLKGNSFFEGKYQTVRTNAYFNVPILHVKKNILSGGVGVSHQTMHLYNVTSYDPSLPLGTLQSHNTLAGASLTFTHVDSLFKHPVVYSVSVNGLIDPVTGQYRLAASGVMSLTIRRTQNTTISLGLIALLDPTAPAPVIPFISYYHRFKHGLSFFLDPSAIALRKELNAKNSISLSNNISGNISLFKRDIVNLPINQVYSTFEMKSGLIYERLLTSKTVFSIGTGISTTFTSKVSGDNNKNNSFIKNTQSMVPYIKIGISFLPFWKGLAH